jgi:hypothetical protein
MPWHCGGAAPDKLKASLVTWARKRSVGRSCHAFVCARDAGRCPPPPSPPASLSAWCLPPLSVPRTRAPPARPAAVSHGARRGGGHSQRGRAAQSGRAGSRGHPRATVFEGTARATTDGAAAEPSAATPPAPGLRVAPAGSVRAARTRTVPPRKQRRCPRVDARTRCTALHPPSSTCSREPVGVCDRGVFCFPWTPLGCARVACCSSRLSPFISLHFTMARLTGFAPPCFHVTASLRQFMTATLSSAPPITSQPACGYRPRQAKCTRQSLILLMQPRSKYTHSLKAQQSIVQFYTDLTIQ